MNTLLITGGGGFLGGHLAASTPREWETVITWFSTPVAAEKPVRSRMLDITDTMAVESLVQEVAPQVIIHAAAMTGLDFCAKNRDAAWRVNVTATENLAQAAEKIKARFIYISSDLVYPGDKTFFTEEDPPRPVCYYGKTKLEGEKRVAAASTDYCIVRLSFIYGYSVNRAACFTEQMIANLKKGERVRVFTDEYRSPIYACNLCEILFEIAARKDVTGVLNICGSERVSRHEFGLFLAHIFGFGKEFLFPVRRDSQAFSENRPGDCSMKNQKALSLLKTPIMSFEQGLEAMAANRWKAHLLGPEKQCDSFREAPDPHLVFEKGPANHRPLG